MHFQEGNGSSDDEERSVGRLICWLIMGPSSQGKLVSFAKVSVICSLVQTVIFIPYKVCEGFQTS